MRAWLVAVGLTLAGAAAAQEATGGEEGVPASEVPGDGGPGADEAVSGEAEDADDTDLPDDVDLELTIYPELRVKRARQALIEAAGEEGYVQRIERKDRTILRHTANWRGEVVLHDDGRVWLKRQPIQFEPPTKKQRPVDYLWCVLVPLCVRPAGQTVSPRRFRGYEREALHGIHDEVTELNDRIADLALRRKLGDLPDRLEALWTDGTPLEGDGPPLATPAARRAALLDHWDSRTATPWGEQVRDAVAGFLRAVVQSSDHPFTVEELAAFEARRTAPRPLALEPVDPGIARP